MTSSWKLTIKYLEVPTMGLGWCWFEKSIAEMHHLEIHSPQEKNLTKCVNISQEMHKVPNL
jgi:hypothetical protein